MRTKILSLLTGIIFLSSIVDAQIDVLGYAFQGYALDIEGKALKEVDITVKFTITNNITSAAFSEEHLLTSDVFGVFTAIVGSINTSAFKLIDYSKIQILKVEVAKTEVPLVYITIHDGQLQCVPYAKYAENASKADTASYAINATTAKSSPFATNAIKAVFATNAGDATIKAYFADSTAKSRAAVYAIKADTAVTAINADTTRFANYSTTAHRARVGGKAQNSEVCDLATNSSYAKSSLASDTSETSVSATFSENGAPIGTIIAFAGFIVPDGWLPCDGSTITSDHPELIALVGSETPDLRSEFLRGLGIKPSVNLGNKEAEGTALPEPNIKLKLYTSGISFFGSYDDDMPTFLRELDNDAAAAFVGFDVRDAPTISYANAEETRPVNTAVLFIIKY